MKVLNQHAMLVSVVSATITRGRHQTRAVVGYEARETATCISATEP